MTTKPLDPNKPVEMLKAETIKQVGDLPAKASKFKVITTDAELLEADKIDGLLDDMIKLIQAELKPLKDAANKAHKAITKYEGEKIAPLTEARGKLSRLVRDCMDKRQLIANEQARLQSVENARLAREQAELGHAARVEVLVAEGRDDEAMELMGGGVVVENIQAVRVEVSRPLGLGMHTVSRWVGEVHNLRMLVDAVASGKLPLGTVENPGPVMVNQAYLNKVAQLEKSTMMYPGVTAKDVGGTSR